MYFSASQRTHLLDFYIDKLKINDNNFIIPYLRPRSVGGHIDNILQI